MPKKKTHKGAAKRCKLTAKGKVKATHAAKRHLASCKTRKRKRNLRGTDVLAKAEQKRYAAMLTA